MKTSKYYEQLMKHNDDHHHHYYYQNINNRLFTQIPAINEFDKYVKVLFEKQYLRRSNIIYCYYRTKKEKETLISDNLDLYTADYQYYYYYYDYDFFFL